MARQSPFFARIKAHVTVIVAAIPVGRVMTFKDIGEWLDVPPRHVAYILATLDPGEQPLIPWFRVVNEAGTVAAGRANAFGISQQQLLADEGVTVAPDGRILGFGQSLVCMADLAIDLPRQFRPADAPVAKGRKPLRKHV
jgi:methylated-DNA-protein-cysteine methyltransferase related protein